jgi:hypothetical protein
MSKALCAGAFALAISGILSTVPRAAAYERSGIGVEQAPSASIDVARLRSALRLTPLQEAYWPAVEAALRDVARRQTRAEPRGVTRRVSHGVVSIVLDSAAVARLTTAARPLVGVLDMGQLQAANGLADEMGLGPVVAALR